MAKYVISWCIAGIVFCAGAWPATTLNITSTAQQAVFAINTDQPTDSCSLAVWITDSTGAKQLAHDVNPSLFPASDQCLRDGNQINNGTILFVVGKRTAEIDQSGVNKVSRSLQAVTSYTYQLTVGSDVMTGEFTTSNIPLGNTYQEPRFDRSRPGEYAYPTIDWTPAGKAKIYADPLTGAGVKRMTGPGELIPSTNAGKTFASAAALGSGWTITGLQAIYSGTSQAKVYYRIADPSWPGSDSFDYATLQLVGASSSGSKAVNVCLTNDGINCAGATVQKPLTSSSANYTVGDTTPILSIWRNGPNVPSAMSDVKTGAGTATLSGTTLTWASGTLFSTNVGNGGTITLGGTDCLISSITNEQKLVLQAGSGNCSTNGSYSFTQRNFGFLLWDSSASSDTLTITSATWTFGASGWSYFPSAGGYDMCSPVATAGPTGNGYVCGNGATTGSYLSQNTLFWVGDDGTVNPIGMTNGNSAALQHNGTCSFGTGIAWDHTVAGKFYCLGTKIAGNSLVVFSVQYTGDYSPVTVAIDSVLAPATTTILSGDITAEVAAFNSAFSAFTPNAGWVLVGTMRDNLILECTQNGQNTPAWVAVYNTTSNKITAAFNTYGGSQGAANRWGDAHSVFTTGDTDWILISGGSQLDLPYQVNITSGTLTSTFATCPTNTFGVTGTNCSQVVISSITPTNPSGGASLFGQTLLPGDYMNVTKGGSGDGEQVRIMTMSGTTIWLQRNVRPYNNSNLNHSGSLELRVATAVDHELWVNYVDDPTAATLTKAYGLTVLEDPQTYDCHQVYNLGQFLGGCLKPNNFPPDPTGLLTGTPVRVGDLPTSSSTSSPWLNPFWWTGANAAFNGNNYQISGNLLESHPSMTQYNASSWEKKAIFDGRVYMGDTTISTSSTVTKVGTYTYKVSAAGISTPSDGGAYPNRMLNYKQQPLLVTSGTHPLVDTSPLLTDAVESNYTYCYVVNSGDCWSDSAVGELYANIPYAAVPYCYASRFANPLSLSDLCVTANTNATGTVSQVAAPYGNDFIGAYTRRLSTHFTPYKIQDAFWNVRATPNAKWVYGPNTSLSGVRPELMMALLPPFPQETTGNPGGFAEVQVPVGANVVLAKVRARFGYAENGKRSKYFCTSRQVECTTSGSPFSWVDEVQTVQNCPAGCIVHIPAIVDRVMYYVLERSADGNTWTAEAPQIVVVTSTSSLPRQCLQ